MTQVLRTHKDLQAFRMAQQGLRVGFVPTMGNLHDGHISLMNIAKQHADVVIASIFVNPTQFGVNEDLDAYPRTFTEDLEKLEAAGVEAVFFPDEQAIYPYGKEHTLSIHMPQSMTNILCGLDRPTHFQGVATVVAKLFQLVQPNVVVFGEKDFQQLAIIRRLVKELFMDIDIIAGDIVREPSGLAMSSRNQYLSDDDCQRAALLSQTLQDCKKRIVIGDGIRQVLCDAKASLASHNMYVEYLDFRDVDTLAECSGNIQNGILLIACRVGSTRLIDNLRIAL